MKELLTMMVAAFFGCPLFATTWYVNGTSGSDGYSGKSSESAKKTIQAAIDTASDGDTILVAAGTYDPINAVGKVLTIRGVSGASMTIIDGKGAKRCAWLSDEEGHFGPPAESSGAFDSVLEGFTLKNGWSALERVSNSDGAGVRGGTVRDCIIEGGHSYAGGGASCAKLFRCIVRNNVSEDDGGGVMECIVHDSLIHRNEAHNEFGGEAGSAASCSRLYNCTVTENVATGRSGYAAAIDYYMTVYNSIIWGNTDTSGNAADVIYSDVYNCCTTNPKFVDAANGNYRLAADSSCIDAGDNAYVTAETDLAGEERIVSGRVDIGCYEYGSSGKDGLVAWYKFDGNANDSSGSGHNLVNQGAVAIADRFGQSLSAYYFDGSSQLISANDVVLAKESGTIACWIKTDAEIPQFYQESIGGTYYQAPYVLFPTLGDDIMGTSWTYAGIGFAAGSNGIMVFEHSGYYLPASLVYESTIGSGWNHIVISFENDGAATLFVNGVSVKTGLVSSRKKVVAFSSQGQDSTHEQLGGIGGGCYGNFSGCIDDFRVYNRALSVAEVKALYEGDGTPVVTKCAVTFDAAGGTAGWTKGEVAKGAAVGTLPTATRAGYEFLGWFTAAVGGTQVTAATVVTADVTFYAQWTPIEYDISYLYLKGSENPNPATYTIEDELTFTALSDILGWTFVGWSLDGISLGSTGDKTVSARWTPVTYGISYAGVKGGANPNPTSYTIEDAITFTALSDVMGYRFAGWSPRGIEVGTTGNKTITAQYEPIRYAITYVNTMGAANPNPTSYTIEDAVTFAALPDVEGWRFVGWSFAGISRGNTGDVTVSANWEAIAPSVIPDDEDPMDAGVANTYDGIIMDADGLPVGYISIKAGKASGKGAVGTSKVTATIQMVGEAKKVTVKGNVNVSEATFVQPAPDGRVLDLMFTRNSIFGTFDGYEIEGVRNILASTAKGDKGSEAKQRAEAIYGRLKGNYVMAYGDENGWNGLSVSVAAKGKVKVSGKLADGTSVATSTQLIVGEDYSCIPVIYTKKDVSLAFSIYFSNDGGELSVFGYYDAVISRVTALGGERAFCLDGDPYGIFEEAGYELVEEFLPWEVPVAPKGTKWIVADGAKAGQIKMDKDGEVYDKKESDNPSGLKLTFTAKTGLFKGSFKVYAIDAKGKLKSFSATVNGIVVDGIGYGTVTIKKIGSVPVAIE